MMTELTDEQWLKVRKWHGHIDQQVLLAEERADGALSKQERKWWTEYGEHLRLIEMSVYARWMDKPGSDEIRKRVDETKRHVLSDLVHILDEARTNDEKELLQARIDAVNDALRDHMAITGIA